MPFSKEVQQVLDEIRAMPATVAKDVDVPIRIFLQIAVSVCERALRDVKELAKCNYDTGKITKIRLLIELLRELSALYTDVQFDKPETRKAFVKLREEAETMRYEILSAMDLAFADDDNLLFKLSKIREGNSVPDLIQDMSDIKVLYENNSELLDRINFDKSIVERIPQVNSELSRLFANATLDKSDKPETRIDRDKVYTVLKDMLIELNRVGRYTFRHDPARAENYSIAYHSRKRKAKEAKPAAQAA